jgi:outer membrane protein TolC
VTGLDKAAIRARLADLDEAHSAVDDDDLAATILQTMVDIRALLGALEAADAERDRLARQVEAFKHTAGDVAQRYQGEVATLRKALAAMNDPIQLWNHAEACVTGTGCTHDSDSDCADSLLHHAANLMT